MEPMKVIARYRDGRMVRGTTRNLRPETNETFHLLPCGHGAHDPLMVISLADLKAVFVVKTFSGDPAYTPSNDLPPQAGHGLVLDVEFLDGEHIRGQSMTFTTRGQGFWMTPVDEGSNNRRIYVVREATRSVSRERALAV